MMELILASASPRRQSLLSELGFNCIVKPQDIDESPLPNENPEKLVKRLAMTKANTALGTMSETDQRLVLGSDTIVVCEDKILGKPTDKTDGIAMLSLLSGQTHQVLTAVALVNHSKQAETMSSTEVTFTSLSEAEMTAYWDSGEPLGKAGAYAIQGLGAMFVNEINGSYSGVVGLPLFETVQLLTNFGVDIQTILHNQSS